MRTNDSGSDDENNSPSHIKTPLSARVTRSARSMSLTMSMTQLIKEVVQLSDDEMNQITNDINNSIIIYIYINRC